MKASKYVFIPFYWARNERRDGMDVLSWIHGVFLALYIVVRLSLGLYEANLEDGCIIRSVGDVIITPMYAIGCNIGKDRFEIKIN